jgi:lysozyme family protein
MKPINRRDHYDAERCGEMPLCVAMAYFVDATLTGSITPVKNLEAAVGVAPEGVIGPHALASPKDADPKAVTTQLKGG